MFSAVSAPPREGRVLGGRGSASVVPWRRLWGAVSKGAAWWQGAGVGGGAGLQCEGKVGAWETAGSDGWTLAEVTTEVTRLRSTLAELQRT